MFVFVIVLVATMKTNKPYRAPCLFALSAKRISPSLKPSFVFYATDNPSKYLA